MNLLPAAFVILAFAGIYAMVFAMLGEHVNALATALAGQWRPAASNHQTGGSAFAASRRFSLA